MSRPPFRVSHVLLDVDGTLVDFDPALEAALRAASGLASELTGTLVTPTHLSQAREMVWAEPGWTLKAARDESFRRVLSAAGVRDEGAVERVSATYYEVRDRSMEPYPETNEVLAELAARGFTLMAGTNGNAALEQFDFARHLAVVHQADVVGVKKPAPAFYLGALAEAGARAEMTISVGDRVENDVDGPRAVGMEAIFLDRAGVAPDIDVPRITTLRELPGMLELA